MSRMALDWTLSRIQRVDFEAPPQTWEQYSKEGWIWDLYIYLLNMEEEYGPTQKRHNRDRALRNSKILVNRTLF